MSRERWRRLVPEALLVAAICLAYTLFRTLTAQGFLYYVRKSPMPFLRIFPGELLTHCLWGIFFFVIRALVHCFRKRIPRVRARLAAHALMYLLTPLLLRTLSLWLYEVLDLWKSIPGNFQGARLLGVAYSRWLFYDYILYAVLLGLILFFDAFKREKEYKMARLQAELRQVAFRNLSEELRPRFVLSLFDELALQIETDPDRAATVVSRFSSWLRSLQDMATSLWVPLRDELDFFKSYLDIERLCRAPGLETDLRLPEEALAWPVPPLLLQPLVEEPLIRLSGEGKPAARVILQGAVADGCLELRLDVGPATAPGEATIGNECGLDRRLRDKLASLYGEGFSCRVSRGRGTAVTIELRLPGREAGGPAQEEEANARHDRG